MNFGVYIIISYEVNPFLNYSMYSTMKVRIYSNFSYVTKLTGSLNTL
jgi:hypothetical protein